MRRQKARLSQMSRIADRQLGVRRRPAAPCRFEQVHRAAHGGQRIRWQTTEGFVQIDTLALVAGVDDETISEQVGQLIEKRGVVPRPDARSATPVRRSGASTRSKCR